MGKKKVLLMGKAHSGKTSMRSIIFANYLARDTMRLSATLDVEHTHVRFLGDLVLNLWDCGGQDAFYESYFERDRETIFRSVELLIYVFDIESDSPNKDFEHFAGVLEAIEENSPDARIFALVHKMDLVHEEEREEIFMDRKRLIEEYCAECGFDSSLRGCSSGQLQVFGTSIWDETLYKAWSEIVTHLIPNIGLLKSHLQDFCRIGDADEVVLFEKATFLVISHATRSITDEDSVEMNKDEYDSKATDDGLTSSGSAGLLENALVGGGELDSTTPSYDQYSEPAARDVSSPPENATAKRTTHCFDAHRFEKISNIIKQFKLSCGKTQAQFGGMEVRNSRFAAYIDAFTANTYIMVVVSNERMAKDKVEPATTLLNIKNARRHFERFIPRS
mmetsp:Transcript_3111/g.4529  ORF Transcript_3111/g.4529 Transcript_3111/m.4529 type:complete len:391 (-) Transcript_3111:196-1368(-)|eukprot:CAMPEP_0116014494 /NCGR_PEP_ID=MMETSP0321-20121206/6302_1 /TAXON_ID=163516 /ORGANISM="Leptocylindrus danicus var. danicus, Strain B650" /LENGTH=390 /DNA_ID=CAMNT_0003484139 /DNA_START=32 /DNA_END=1204 /DNA_ORIENTATION=+